MTLVYLIIMDAAEYPCIDKVDIVDSCLEMFSLRVQNTERSKMVRDAEAMWSGGRSKGCIL